MSKYHITKNGEPAICTARIQCRLAEESEHYSSPEEARKAYEEANGANSLKTLRSFERSRYQNMAANASQLKVDTPMTEYIYYFEDMDGKLKIDMKDEDQLPIGTMIVDPSDEREAIDTLAFVSWSPRRNIQGITDENMAKILKAYGVWKENKGTAQDRRLAFRADLYAEKNFDHKLTLEELREESKAKKSKKFARAQLIGMRHLVKLLDESSTARKMFESLH